MKLLWMTWKDCKNPLSGGAEVVNEELARRLAADGHEVILLVSGFPGAAPEETINGYKVIRVGTNRYLAYILAWRYYRRHLRGWADLVIDEMNTMPFFAKFYVKEPNIMLAYQLCREIWFYQFPPVLSHIGYMVEPIYLRLVSDRRVITESASAKADLVRHGFKADRVSIVPVGLERPPLPTLDGITKYERPTMLSLGALRPMKNTLAQVKAFEVAKAQTPTLQLKIAGDASDPYGKSVLAYIARSPHKADIEYLGRVSAEQKLELMQRAHFIAVTSIKEGWGLIITEAASMGTPAVVYDADGLRDSVRHGHTGLVASENTPAGLAAAATELLADPERYEQLRQQAWEWSKEFTYDRSYESLLSVLQPLNQSDNT